MAAQAPLLQPSLFTPPSSGSRRASPCRWRWRCAGSRRACAVFSRQRHGSGFAHPLRGEDMIPGRLLKRREILIVRASMGEGEEGTISGGAAGDWREFRARLVQGQKGGAGSRTSWAHPLAAPETGCILIAHPSAFGARQQYFHQSVIFIFAHGDEGTAGVILNRPTEFTLGQLAGFEELNPVFSDCPLYMGGDVGEESTHVIHGHGDLEGAKEIISGVYVGGYSALKDHMNQGRSSPMDYRWFARYSGWGPGQLEKEVGAGVWFLASCSKDLILKHAVRLTVPLWRETLELMGGEYAVLAKGDF